VLPYGESDFVLPGRRRWRRGLDRSHLPAWVATWPNHTPGHCGRSLLGRHPACAQGDEHAGRSSRRRRRPVRDPSLIDAAKRSSASDSRRFVPQRRSPTSSSEGETSHRQIGGTTHERNLLQHYERKSSPRSRLRPGGRARAREERSLSGGAYSAAPRCEEQLRVKLGSVIIAEHPPSRRGGRPSGDGREARRVPFSIEARRRFAKGQELPSNNALVEIGNVSRSAISSEGGHALDACGRHRPPRPTGEETFVPFSETETEHRFPRDYFAEGYVS
jgi:hypothetical protein